MSLLRTAALAALALLLLPACDSDGTDDPTGERAVYIGNAGNFQENNGSLTRFAIEDGTASTPLTADSLRGLVQNVVQADGRLVVLLNFDDSFTTGRGRLDLLDLATGLRTAQVDVRTPRGFAFQSDGEPTSAWVSNLYADTVTPVDFAAGTAGTAVAVGATPEGLAAAGSRLYVANSGFGTGTSLSVLDRFSGAPIETVEDVCTGPRTLTRDQNAEIWVVCTGASDFTTGEVTAPGEVVVLDGRTGAEVERFTFDGQTLGSATLGQDAAYSPGAGELYVIADGGVVRFDTNANTRGATIPVDGAVGAVGYDRVAERLYVARPNASSPFGDDGTVTVHDRSGAQVGSFRAGIAPVAVVVTTASGVSA